MKLRVCIDTFKENQDSLLLKTRMSRAILGFGTRPFQKGGGVEEEESAF